MHLEIYTYVVMYQKIKKYMQLNMPLVKKYYTPILL